MISSGNTDKATVYKRRLLNALLITLLIIGVLAICAPFFLVGAPDYANFSKYEYALLSVLVIGGLALLLVRWRSYQSGAAAFIFCLMLIIPYLAYPNSGDLSELNLLTFYILPVMLANIFFNLTGMGLAVLGSLAGMIVTIILIPQVTLVDFFTGPGALFISVIGVVLLAQRHHNLIDQERSKSALAAQTLRLEYDKERELNEIKSHMMRMISHEFRTPLTAIRTAAELVQIYSERMTPEQRQGHFETIYREVEFLADMVEDVTTVAKLQSGGVALQVRPLNLDAFCADLIASFQRRIEPDHVFTLQKDADLGAVLADPLLLRHILSNLLSNAAKYSPPGSEVVLRAYRSDTCVCFEVIDHGVGIAPEDTPRLFEPFFRGGNSKDQPGSGLGLKIVADCVRLYDGKIAFVSAVGVGSTFKVELPLPTNMS